MTAPATNLELRRASVADVEVITRIWHQGWRDGHLGHVPRAILPHRSRAAFRRRVPDQVPDTVVAVLGGQVVGFITVRDDEIEQLYVAEAARGTGTAAALLRHGEQIVRSGGHSCSWLAVAPGNARARRFYEREAWYDAGGIEYGASTADGERILVPCRRYEKALTRSAESVRTRQDAGPGSSAPADVEHRARTSSKQ